ncbi:YVTN repeat-like/Quino protein amine dehydrogenase [Suillus decipiens]|nr:YVTN repeat-like/Quino protein amine dehydrogenase [Suillus decipiens]
MASSSTWPSAAENKSILTPVVTLKGHEPHVIHYPGSGHFECKNVSSISYFPDGKQMISGSGDKTIRQWNLREGKEIEKAREVFKDRINAVVVSRDGRWVATSTGKELKVSEVETGIVRTFNEGDWIDCIDISADSTLLAGTSIDAVWIWNLDTGKIVASSFNLGDHHSDIVLRFSEDSRKLAVMSYLGRHVLQVWDVQTQKLVVQKSTPNNSTGWYLPVPVFWTTKDKSIIAAFTFTRDRPTMIYEFDASTLKTVGPPFKGTRGIGGLALSHDSVLLASSCDDAIKLWAFESRQLLASFALGFQMWSLVLSPDSRQLAYTIWDDTNIYIWDMPANVLASIGLAEEPQPSVDVPLAPAKLRYAAAGAPSNDDDDLIRDEDYVPPPSPNPRSRSGSVNAGQHGRGRFCFCL